MDYSKLYEELIEGALERGWDRQSAPCYVEIHHIIPRCLGGTDERENLVALTGQEHFMAHFYLWKINTHNHGLARAFMMMADGVGETRVDKIDISNIPNFADEYNAAKIIKSESQSRVASNVNARTISNGTHNFIGLDTGKRTLNGIVHCEFCNEDIKRAIYNRHHGKYCKYNPNRVASPSGWKTKKVECPHCGKVGGASGMMYRWHFDNCKQRGK